MSVVACMSILHWPVSWLGILTDGYCGCQVYVEFGGFTDDHMVGFACSRLYRLLDRHQHTIRLRVNVPKMSPTGMLIASL